MLAPPALTENEIQRAVFDHLRTRAAPRTFAFHPKNGGVHQRTKARRGNNAGLGVVSGVPDVIIVHDGRTFALELKTAKNKPTEDQLITMTRLEDAGAVCEVAYGLDAAIAQLESWGLLTGRAA